MTAALVHLDRILRGDTTRLDRLRANSLAELPIPALLMILIALAGSYGLCMGVYAITGSGNGEFRQVISSIVKVPSLFGLTLMVTLPSLYVFNALLGSRLTFVGQIRLMVASMGVTMAVLASIGPIVAFFSVTTSSYPFILLLNVFVFAASGLLGLGFLKQTLDRIALIERPIDVIVDDDDDPAPSVIPERPVAPIESRELAISQNTRGVFAIWMIVFGLVGSQMAWLLRPFVGTPGVAFEWFGDRGSNFFQAVWAALEQLLR